MQIYIIILFILILKTCLNLLKALIKINNNNIIKILTIDLAKNKIFKNLLYFKSC